MANNTFWCVIQRYTDRGTVSVKGPVSVYAEKQPLNTMQQYKSCDEYRDYFEDFKKAAAFANESRRA